MIGLEAVRTMNDDKYTYSQLVERMERNGNNLAAVAVGRMMDIIEELTGDYPSWNDTAPDWVVKNCIGL